MIAVHRGNGNLRQSGQPFLGGPLQIGLDKDGFNRTGLLTAARSTGRERLFPGDQVRTSFSYLGLDQVYLVSCGENGAGFNLAAPVPRNNTAALYDANFPGLDRFDRVRRMAWTTPAETNLDLTYRYDSPGNIVARVDALANLDYQNQMRDYDQLDRLVQYRRGGGVNPKGTGGKSPANAKFAQQWNLDAAGDWLEFDERDPVLLDTFTSPEWDTFTGSDWNIFSLNKARALWSLQQTRRHNPAGDILAICPATTETTGGPSGGLSSATRLKGNGPLWASPTEDDNGNAIRIPWAKQPDEAQDCVYDAWNRLVSVSQNGLPVAKYEYDGLGRLSRQISFDSQGKESERRNFVHDYAGRVIHEQVSQPVKGKFPPYLIDREHVWGPSGLLFRDRYRPDDSQFERLYAQQDVEGNVVALVSGGRQTATGKITPAPGKVQERYDYDPSARLTVLSPDYTPQANSQFDWNLLWQAGRRDPLTGVYVGGDGAYYERLGKSLNPEVGMAQAKATSRATITARSTPPTRRHSRCCNRQAKNSAGSRKGPCSSAAWQLALASGY